MTARGWWTVVVSTVVAAAPVRSQHAPQAAPTDWRTPVVLVPGWSEEGRDLEPTKELLVEAGWSPGSILTLEFEDPVGSNRIHADELAAAVDSLRQRTGADRVDIVAHSMGGLATRFFLQGGGADDVRRVAFLATPHHGTYTAYLAWGAGGREMKPGSFFLMDLQEFRAVPEGVEAITLRTKVDLHIIPPESAMLTGVPNLEICCPSHVGILTHPEAIEAIIRFFERRP